MAENANANTLYELRPQGESTSSWIVWLPNGTPAGTITCQYIDEWNSNTPFHKELAGPRRKYGHGTKEEAIIAVLEGVAEYSEQQLNQARAAIESLKA